jgi:integrase
MRLKQKRSSTIPLNPLALKLLTEMRAANPDSDFLFPSPTFADRSRSDARKLWAAIRKASGLKTLRMHDLRHVFATAALEGFTIIAHPIAIISANFSPGSAPLKLQARKV